MDFLLTLLLLVLLIIFLARSLFSVFLHSLAKKRMSRNNGTGNRQNVAYKEGETTVISHGEEHSEVPKDFGDYTDYEEIKNE